MLLSLFAFVRNFMVNNWSLVVGILGAVIAVKLLKSGVQLAITLIFIALVITILTNLGVIPPLDQIVAAIKAAIG